MDRGTPDLDAMYRDVVLDHYRNPRGRKPIENPDVENEGTNPVCGDDVKVALKLGGPNIEETHVSGRGCSICTASGSMMAELLPGKSLQHALLLADALKGSMRGQDWPPDLERGDLDALAGVRNFPVRIKCALLPWTTLVDALAAHGRGENRPAGPTTTETGEDAG